VQPPGAIEDKEGKFWIDGSKGGHGYGSRRTGRDNDAWPELAAVWLRRTLGLK